MGEVIQGPFGLNNEDVQLLADILSFGKVPVEPGYKPDEAFRQLAKFSLQQEKALRAVYVDLGDVITIAACRYYESKIKSDSELQTFQNIRQIRDQLEKTIIEKMR